MRKRRHAYPHERHSLVKEMRAHIVSNTKNINPKAYLPHLERAATLDRSAWGDTTLTRLSAVIDVIAQHNCLDHLQHLKLSIDSLNQWRSLQNCKPDGFQALVDHESGKVFRAAVDAGFGLAQLEIISYLFSYDELEWYGLTFLRSRANRYAYSSKAKEN